MPQTREQEAADVLAKNLRRLRTNADLSQEQLAEKAGVSRLTITYLENARNGGVLASTLQAIAKVLGTSVDDLLEKPARGAR